MAKNKKGGIPTPDVIDPPESMRMTLCIPKNKDHMMAFFGALWELTMWDSWQPDAAHTGKELAAVWYRYWLSWDRSMNDLECEDEMANCCTEPSITRRVNPSTGQLEQSVDGGSHWTPASGGLPSYIVQPVPPVTSGVAATKCDAATNVREQCSQWVNQVSNDFDTATTLLEFAELVALAIAGAVLVVLTGGAFTPVQISIITALGAALVAAWGAGKTVFDAYWVSDKLDIVLCAAYCSIGDDGSFTDAQFSEFWNKCNEDLPPSPAKMLFMGFMSSIGTAGLNAMAASGFSADADCSDCACVETCPEVWQWWPDFQALGGTVTYGEDYIEVETVPAAGIYYVCLKTPAIDLCCYIVDTQVQSGGGGYFGGVTTCNNERSEYVPQLTSGIYFVNTCINMIYMTYSEPTVVRMYFGDCP